MKIVVFIMIIFLCHVLANEKLRILDNFDVKNLDNYITIIDGVLTWGPGGFRQYCQNIHVNGATLTASCQNTDGSLLESSINLENYLDNLDYDLLKNLYSDEEQVSELETDLIQKPSDFQEFKDLILAENWGEMMNLMSRGLKFSEIDFKLILEELQNLLNRKIITFTNVVDETKLSEIRDKESQIFLDMYDVLKKLYDYTETLEFQLNIAAVNTKYGFYMWKLFLQPRKLESKLKIAYEQIKNTQFFDILKCVKYQDFIVKIFETINSYVDLSDGKCISENLFNNFFNNIRTQTSDTLKNFENLNTNFLSNPTSFDQPIPTAKKSKTKLENYIDSIISTTQQQIYYIDYNKYNFESYGVEFGRRTKNYFLIVIENLSYAVSLTEDLSPLNPTKLGFTLYLSELNYNDTNDILQAMIICKRALVRAKNEVEQNPENLTQESEIIIKQIEDYLNNLKNELIGYFYN